MQELSKNEAPSGGADKSPDARTSDKKFRIFGYIVLIATFGIFGVWSAFAPIDSAALAPGYVDVKFDSKTVQHLEGGIVKRLHVSEGMHVDAGDILIELDTTQLAAEREILMGQMFTFKALESRLLAEQLNLPEVEYSAVLTESDDSRAKEAMAVQNQIFKTRQDSLTGEKDVLTQRVKQLRERRAGLLAQKEGKQNLQASLDDEITEITELLSDGYADKQRLRERERQLTDTVGLIGELSAEIASTEIQAGETELEIIQLTKTRAEEVAEELSDAQAQLFDITQKLYAVQDRISKSEIKAPATGSILGLKIHTEGGVVSQGEPIMNIVPSGGELTVISEVAPNDIDRVTVGLEAEIRFSAFSQSTTPKLTGKVVNVSPDRLQRESDGTYYYEARLEVTQQSLKKMSQHQGGMTIVPGMPVETLISTGKRTLIQYLSKPITDAFKRSFLEE